MTHDSKVPDLVGFGAQVESFFARRTLRSARRPQQPIAPLEDRSTTQAIVQT